MSDALIPRPDTITVAWGWFQFLLLLTFPVHLLAMNAMVGGLAIGVVQHFKGGPVRLRLAHRLAILLPLVIAFAVNFGVAPLLFSQVLYGHLFYTSSILMGPFWLAIIPVLILAYYGAYLYDFRFRQLAGAGRWLALVILLVLLAIGFLFVNNMLLMILPERFAAYFSNMGGSLPAADHPVLLPRYLHMMTGAVAVGGLFVALAGRFQADRDPELAAQARDVGLQTFFWGTAVNVLNGLWFLLAQPREIMLIFMGGNLPATICFTAALLVVVVMLFYRLEKKTVADLLAGPDRGFPDDLPAGLAAGRLPAGGLQSRPTAGRAGILADVVFLCDAAPRSGLHRLDAEEDRGGHGQFVIA